MNTSDVKTAQHLIELKETAEIILCEVGSFSRQRLVNAIANMPLGEIVDMVTEYQLKKLEMIEEGLRDMGVSLEEN